MAQVPELQITLSPSCRRDPDFRIPPDLRYPSFRPDRPDREPTALFIPCQGAREEGRRNKSLTALRKASVSAPPPQVERLRPHPGGVLSPPREDSRLQRCLHAAAVRTYDWTRWTRGLDLVLYGVKSGHMWSKLKPLKTAFIEGRTWATMLRRVCIKGPCLQCP